MSLQYEYGFSNVLSTLTVDPKELNDYTEQLSVLPLSICNLVKLSCMKPKAHIQLQAELIPLTG